jgi:hypothetical protein
MAAETKANCDSVSLVNALIIFITLFLSTLRLAISDHTVVYSKLSSDATSGDQTSIGQCLVVG